MPAIGVINARARRTFFAGTLRVGGALSAAHAQILSAATIE
jgi:hypothetical protein